MEEEAGVCHWDSLPEEIEELLLQWTIGNAIGQRFILRCVCNRWKRILLSVKSNYTSIFVSTGPLSTLQWARANGCPWSEKSYKKSNKTRVSFGVEVDT